MANSNDLRRQDVDINKKMKLINCYKNVNPKKFHRTLNKNNLTLYYL